MYLPTHFADNDPAELHRLIEQYPLGLLIDNTPTGVSADLIPLQLQAGNVRQLIGHIARANPLGKRLESREVLVVFNGPSHYVSPHYYPSKRLDPKVVPTWNYAMVQVRGQLSFIQDADAIREIVTTLTDRHERALAHTPWQVSDAPAEYIDKMLTAIIGIRIDISEMEGKFKASQNRSATDREGVLTARTQQVGPDLAAWTVRAPHST
jgi:transcriptional regulator